MKSGKTLSLIAMVVLLACLTVIPAMAQSLPQLRDGSVNLSSGTSSTNFYYQVSYYDPDGDSPVVAQVYIDDVAYTMSLDSGSPSNGVYCFGPKNLVIGNHSYYFYFDDGKDGEARLPQTGSFSGPMVNPTYAQNNPDVAVGFDFLEDKLVIAYGYKAGKGVGGWTCYCPSWPAELNTLEILHVGRGYWINVNDACNLEYGAQTYSLDAGWNLIGWVGW